MTYTFFRWLVNAILVLVFFIFYCELHILVLYFVRKLKHRDTRKILYKPLSIVVHLLTLFWIYFGIVGFFIEPYRVKVNTIPIYTDKLKNTYFRIVQISDLHCVKKMKAEKKVVELINQIKPDVIVFTGDTLSDKDGLQNFRETMAAMNAPLGKFAVTGNWDEHQWKPLQPFAFTGFKELICGAEIITKNNETIRIAGMDFYQKLEDCQALKTSNADLYTIFIYHRTDIVDYGDDLPIDVFLCGHTHGGQVLIPFYGAITTFSRHGKKYVHGLYDMGHFKMYVNRGIGMEGGPIPPVRFGALPEITVFEIQPAAKKGAAIPASDL
jgi:predicted MPP superfamily phosphohydrolase